jgi:AcrR family transcriptional regulator
MRRLGAELDAGAMSLYHHVASRDELLDGLSEVMIGRLEAPAATDDWRDALRRFMGGIRAVAGAHPEAFRLVGMRPLTTRAALPPIEALLGALRDGGFGDDLAVGAYRCAAAYARGYALAEIGGFTLEGSDEPRLAPSDLSPDDFPHIVAVGRRLHGADRDAAFALGVEIIVAGLAAVHAARQPPASPARDASAAG